MPSRLIDAHAPDMEYDTSEKAPLIQVTAAIVNAPDLDRARKIMLDICDLLACGSSYGGDLSMT